MQPLVSGAALKFEGQLTVYNYKEGPCYRCLYPTPPPPHTVTSCSEGGVMGVTPGIIGTMQAQEAIKVITNMEGNTCNCKQTELPKFFTFRFVTCPYSVNW